MKRNNQHDSLVLLLEGFDIGITDLAQTIKEQHFVTSTGRGFLRWLDVVFLKTLPFIVTNDLTNFTLNVGGQNVIENEGLPNWGFNSQFGKDNLWNVRTFAQENQTINFTVDNTKGNITTLKMWQLIASYSTEVHEDFLRSFRLDFNTGLKRKGYQMQRLATTTNVVNMREVLPRKNGRIIGIAISNSGNIELIDQINTLISIKIDGITIIKEVVIGYFNSQSGRDSYLLPIEIQAGATMDVELKPVAIPSALPAPPIEPAQETTTISITLYFSGNE